MLPSTNWATVVEPSTGVLTTTRLITSMPSSTFISGPARQMTMRRQTGIVFSGVLPRSASSKSSSWSSAYSPTIDTKPPMGSARTEKTLCLPRRENSFGPMPMANSLMPT